MKTLCTALALVASTTVAHAERFTLLDHKAWSVSWNEHEGAVFCDASVSGNGLYFSLVAAKGGGLEVYIVDESKDWTSATDLNMFVFIDNRRGWNISDVTVSGTMTTFPIYGENGPRFIRELTYGQKVYIDYNAQNTPPDAWDVGFSLAGSAAAMAALNDCIGKL